MAPVFMRCVAYFGGIRTAGGFAMSLSRGVRDRLTLPERTRDYTRKGIIIFAGRTQSYDQLLLLLVISWGFLATFLKFITVKPPAPGLSLRCKSDQSSPHLPRKSSIWRGKSNEVSLFVSTDLITESVGRQESTLACKEPEMRQSWNQQNSVY